ncbi:MAG: hypothetical protein E7613_01065 [Ruminococcaceae bacterium]|nr:hypothetical protein [Oscillospiraceae bacterium]
MNSKKIDISEILLLRKRTKFGIHYYDALIENEKYKVRFPWFEEVCRINDEILKIICKLPNNCKEIEIKLVFANSGFISLMVDDFYSINYSMIHMSFLPPKMVLKSFKIKRGYYNKVISQAKKKYYVKEQSLRCTADGIRIDVIDKNTLIKSSLKIRNVKKISQTT